MNMVRSKIVTSVKNKRNSFLLFFLPIILTTIGLFFIFDASSITAFRTLGDSFYFLKLQLIWMGIGIIAMIFFSLFDYRKLYYLAFPGLVITIILLIIVLIPGVGSRISGARRWIDLGVFSIQPTEIAKFGVILYLCSWFKHREKHAFGSFLLLLGFVMALIMIQPDMGTAIIIFSLFIAIYYLAGNNLVHLFFLAPVAAGVIYFLIKIAPYRLSRLMVFLDPQKDPMGIGYHINQILISLSSGGLLGRGLSASRQKYQFLPEAHTDSIFALIGLQAIINLGSMVGIMPLTGIPLPFISYGGSSLLIFFSLMGIVLSISKK